MNFSHVIDQAARHPTRLFRIDAVGAALSAFLIGVVLVKFQMHFGMPVSSLYLLAAVPACFVFYDAAGMSASGSKQRLLLFGIGVMNILYCGFSLGLLFYNINTVTVLGWMYFVGEISIVLVLALIELKTAQTLKESGLKNQ